MLLLLAHGLSDYFDSVLKALMGPAVSDEKMFGTMYERRRRLVTKALLYDELTLWAFGTGELKCQTEAIQTIL